MPTPQIGPSHATVRPAAQFKHPRESPRVRNEPRDAPYSHARAKHHLHLLQGKPRENEQARLSRNTLTVVKTQLPYTPPNQPSPPRCPAVRPGLLYPCHLAGSAVGTQKQPEPGCARSGRSPEAAPRRRQICQRAASVCATRNFGHVGGQLAKSVNCQSNTWVARPPHPRRVAGVRHGGRGLVVRFCNVLGPRSKARQSRG